MVVGVSVAIILFEGGYHLRLEKPRESPRTLLRLATVGATITWLGTAGAVAVFLDTSLEAGLLIATGSTVIGPILQVVTVRNRVAAVLEGEGR